MNRSRNTQAFALLMVLGCAGLVCSQSAFGNSIAYAGDSPWQYSSTSLEDNGFSGWFYNSTAPFLFPSQPDPSQPWTSAENIALMNAWLSLVTQAAGDPALLAQLNGLGMHDIADSFTFQSSLTYAGQIPDSVPEPPLLGFLGSGLSLLVLLAFVRIRHH